MKIGEPDERGRLSTHASEGSEFELEADTVIMAVSQYADFPFIDKDEVELTEFGKLVLDEERMTTLPGVFAVSYTHLDVYKRQQQWCQQDDYHWLRYLGRRFPL